MNNLDENFIIKETEKEIYQVWQYLYGSCHLFALVLSQQNNLKVGGFFRENSKGEIDGIEHVFCYSQEEPSIAIDCRGKSTVDDLKQEYQKKYSNINTILDCHNIVKKLMQDGKINDFGKNEESIIKEFVAKINKESDLFKPPRKPQKRKVKI